MGAGGAATDTAGNFSGLSLKGAAGGAAEAKGDGEPSLFSTLAALGAPCVAALASATTGVFCRLTLKGAAEVAAVGATGNDLPVARGAGLTAPSSSLLSLKGAAGVAAKVFDGGPSFFLVAA